MKSLSMKNGFSFDRFLQVTFRTLQINKRTYALGFGGFFVGLYGLWILAELFVSGTAEAQSSTMILGFGILVYQIAGYVLTATVFSELQSSDSAPQMLTLPAAASEKLSSAWVVSFVLYSTLAFTTLFILGFLMWVTADLFFGRSVSIAMDAITPVQNLLTYLLFNSVFLLGAIYFKGNNFLKTAFSILLLFLFIGIQSIILINYIGPESIQSFTIRPPMLLQNIEYAQLLFQAIYTLPLTVLFLTFSYFRLKNRQIV